MDLGLPCGVVVGVLLCVLLAFFCGPPGRAGAAFHGRPFGRGRGPYNIGLYDSPRYYPYYQAQDWLAWDTDGRCSAACRSDGCTLQCR
jgi:hypothetical protein